MISCVIPARGGSKGIPRKNVLTICGKPLIVWSIEQAKASGVVDEVWVTTDDAEIGRIADEAGAFVHARSQESATDDAPSELAIREWMDDTRRTECEAIVFLQATSPIRGPDDIRTAVGMVTGGAYDSVFSARRIEGYVWTQSGRNAPCATYAFRSPRQREEYVRLEENGSIYVFRPQSFQRYGNRICGHVGAYLMHPLDSFQLDEPSDVAMIEQLLEIRCGCDATAAN